MDLENIKNNFLNSIKNIKNIDDLKILRSEFLGKKSKINDAMKTLSNLSLEDKKIIGSEVNKIKNFIAEKINIIEKQLMEEKIKAVLAKESLDITLPVRKENNGYIHPMVKVQKELRDILCSMGFSVTNGSEIENDWNCFEGVNIPKHHPARQMQDTFYLKNDVENNNIILLRTQTTSMEVREMTKKQPPFKFICEGKTFRSEMDATHSPMFHQIEGVYVNENVSMQDLKNCLITILKKFFNLKTVPLRFRPSYFPLHLQVLR